VLAARRPQISQASWQQQRKSCFDKQT